MNGWDLPEVVMVGGTPYRVNTDFRDVLDIIDRLTDPNDSEMERWYIAMALFYEDFASIPESDYGEAMTKLAEFIEGAAPADGLAAGRLDDRVWRQQSGWLRRAQSSVPALVHFPWVFLCRWGRSAVDCGRHSE